jgi:hypothetical protein
MQRNSSEMLLKVMSMRSLVGDSIASRVLEQFLMATKGNVDAAVGILCNIIKLYYSFYHLTLNRDVLEQQWCLSKTNYRHTG